MTYTDNCVRITNMSDISREEMAAIRAQFSNPPAVDDAQSEMVGQIPPHRMAPRRMDPSMGEFIPDTAEDHEVVPQSGIGVPRAAMYDGTKPLRPRMPPMMQTPPRGDVCVYEDNGQKFMIRNGCLFKQTWTTVENGPEFRMFDVRKGKKVSPKGIVIQKYEWVPMSVAGEIESCTRPTRQQRRAPVQAPRRVQRPVRVDEQVGEMPPPYASVTNDDFLDDPPPMPENQPLRDDFLDDPPNLPADRQSKPDNPPPPVPAPQTPPAADKPNKPPVAKPLAKPDPKRNKPSAAVKPRAAVSKQKQPTEEVI